MTSVPQLRPNTAFWSALRSRSHRPDLAAGFHLSDRASPSHSLTVNFTDHRMTAIPVPKWAVGTALVGNVSEDGIVHLTEEHPLVIVVVRKTPDDDNPASAFNRAREDYPSLRWRERSSIYNGTGMRGEAPPYWCMLMTRKADGSVETDIGCGVDLLEGVVDGLVRSRPKAPSGLEPPQPQCPDCKKPMESGAVPRIENSGRLVEPMIWQATDRRTRQERDCMKEPPPTLPIRTYRCPACGLLRDYAFTHADWHAWDKAEREHAKAGEKR
jgi:hypothetical protein